MNKYDKGAIVIFRYYQEFKLKTTVKNLFGFFFDKPVTFEFMSKLIRQKKVIEDSSLFISQLYCYDHLNDKQRDGIISPREMLLFFLLYFYPNDLLTLSTPIEKQLWYLTRRVAILFKLFMRYSSKISIEYLKENLEQFVTCFRIWKKQDQECMLTSVGESFYDFTQYVEKLETISEDEKKDIEAKKEELLKRARQLGGPEGVEFVTNYKPMKISFVSEDVVKTTMEKAYWDLIAEELNQTTPDKQLPLFEKLIDEFEEAIIEISPISRHVYVKETVFDKAFLLQMVRHNVFQYNEFKNATNHVLNYFAQIQAPILDKKLEEWKTEFMKKLKTCENTFLNLLPDFFKFSFEHCHEIKILLIDFLEKEKEKKNG